MIDHRAGRPGLLAFFGFPWDRRSGSGGCPNARANGRALLSSAEPTDWDLVKIEGRVREAGGEIMLLSGRLLDRGGAPLADAIVEIWQCDANGRYHHIGDRSSARPLDEEF